MNNALLNQTVFLNRGSTEPLVFDGAISGVCWKVFKILTLSQGRIQGAAGPLILGGKLDVGRRDDLFFFSSGLHLIWGGGGN